METESKNDWKRSAAILGIVLGIAFLGLILFNSGSSDDITGSTVVALEPVANHPWLIGIGALIILTLAGFTLFRLNS